MLGQRLKKTWNKRPRNKKRSTKKTGLRWSFIFFLCGGLTMFFVTQWKGFFVQHSTSQATQGGIYTESVIGSISNLSPFATNTSAIDKDLHALIFEGLLTYDPDTGQIANGLGSLRISEDKKTYTITLKPNIYFHDGRSVTMKDVLFTYEQVLQNPNFPNTFLKESFEYVTINPVDSYSVEFTIPEQNVYFPFLLTQPIIPHRYFKDALIEEIVDPDHPFNKKPIGTGPFKLNNIVTNEDGSSRAFLTHHKEYHQGTPYIEQFVFYLYPNLEKLEENHTWTTGYAHIPQRELDHFINQNGGNRSNYFSQLNQYRQESYILPRYTGIFFNLDRPIVEELAFRKALHTGLPKDRVVKKEKNWTRIDSPFFFDAIANWPDQSPIDARQILRSNNYPFNEEKGGRTNGKDGEKIELTLLTSTQPAVYSRFAQNAKEAWEEELDIRVTLEVLAPAEFQQAVQNDAYDMVLFGINNADNYEALSPWHSSQTDTVNLANLTNQNIDFIISEVRFSGSKRDLVSLNHKLHELHAAIILATPEFNTLISKQLQGIQEGFGKIRSHPQRFRTIYQWYLEEKLSWDWPANRSKIWGFTKWIFGNKNPLERSDVKSRQLP